MPTRPTCMILGFTIAALHAMKDNFRVVAIGNHIFIFFCHVFCRSKRQYWNWMLLPILQCRFIFILFNLNVVLLPMENGCNIYAYRNPLSHENQLQITLAICCVCLYVFAVYSHSLPIFLLNIHSLPSMLCRSFTFTRPCMRVWLWHSFDVTANCSGYVAFV